VANAMDEFDDEFDAFVLDPPSTREVLAEALWCVIATELRTQLQEHRIAWRDCKAVPDDVCNAGFFCHIKCTLSENYEFRLDDRRVAVMCYRRSSIRAYSLDDEQVLEHLRREVRQLVASYVKTRNKYRLEMQTALVGWLVVAIAPSLLARWQAEWTASLWLGWCLGATFYMLRTVWTYWRTGRAIT
jgi:hypothetical protein